MLKLAIECKNLKTSFPLLVSRVPRRPNESFHEIILSGKSRLRKATANGLFTGADTYPLTVSPLYEPGKLVGKSTVQVGRTPNNELTTSDCEVYEKWAQALGSAFDLVSLSVRDYEHVGALMAATLVIPVLVVADDTLWVADYSDQGELLGTPKPADECTIFIGKSFSTGLGGVNCTISHLHVFTKAKFGGFLDRLATNEKYWELIFPPTPLNKQLQAFEKQENA